MTAPKVETSVAFLEGYAAGRKAAAEDVRRVPVRKWSDWFIRRVCAKVAEHGPRN